MKTFYASLTAVTGLAFASVASANHIDFIVDGGFMLSATDESVMGMQMGDGENIIGGEREVTLTGDLGAVSANLNVPAGPGAVGSNVGSVISFVSGATNEGDGPIGSLTLLYNGAGSTGLGGSDFAANWDSISVNLPSVSGSLDLRLTVGDLDSSGFTSIGGITSPGIYDFSFSDSGFSGVDFSMVNSVQVEIDTFAANTSFDIAAITREVVPEPSTGMLALFGCIGLVARRRRTS